MSEDKLPRVIFEQGHLRIVQQTGGYSFERVYTNALSERIWSSAREKDRDDCIEALLDFNYPRPTA